MQQHTGSTEPIINLAAIIAAGLATATAAVVTSRFGPNGLLIGGAFTAMLTTTSTAIYKAYLNSLAELVLLADRPPPPPLGSLTEDRPPPPPLGPLTEDRPPPPPLGPISKARRLPRRLRVLAAFEWFYFQTSPERRRLILSRSLLAGAVVCVIVFGIITAIEHDLGGNLSCLLWQVCSLLNPQSILWPFYG